MAKRRKVKLDEQTVTVGANSTAILDVPPLQSSGFDLVLGIRRIRHGNFSGLWELSELAVEDGQVKSVRIMTDANIKPILIAQIGKALSRCF